MQHSMLQNRVKGSTVAIFGLGAVGLAVSGNHKSFFFISNETLSLVGSVLKLTDRLCMFSHD